MMLATAWPSSGDIEPFETSAMTAAVAAIVSAAVLIGDISADAFD
jgi:hypothetical protein